jgi:hypothetical protein
LRETRRFGFLAGGFPQWLLVINTTGLSLPPPKSENGPMSENPLTEILADIKRLEDATKANLSAIITLLPSIASNHADLVRRVTDLEKGPRP